MMKSAFSEALSVIGDEGTINDLRVEQSYWIPAVGGAALSKGPAGSPEMIGFLTEAVNGRAGMLRALAAEGRVLERQVYRTVGGVKKKLVLSKYAEGKAKLVFHTSTEDGNGLCSIHARTVQETGGTWSFVADFGYAVVSVETSGEGCAVSLKKEGVIDCSFDAETPLSPDAMTIPDVTALQSLSLTVTTDAEAYAAKAGLTGGYEGKLNNVVALAGNFRRTDKPARPDDPTLEEVAVCALGADRSQKVRLLRNDAIDDSYVYYIDSSPGLFLLETFADRKTYGYFNEVEMSRGSFLSLSCSGDKKERVLTVSGQFSSGYLHIHVIRYNSARKEWQILNTTERLPPDRIYLGKNDMKVVMPNPSSLTGSYFVHTVGGKESKRMERKKLPAAKGYRVFTVREKPLDDSSDASGGKRP